MKQFKAGEILQSPQERGCIIPRIQVFFNQVVTSAHSTKTRAIVTSSKELADKQVVVAAGPNATVKVGDWVKINVDTFPKERKPGGHDVGTKTIIHPPLEKIDKTDYLVMNDRNIHWKIDSKNAPSYIEVEELEVVEPEQVK